MQSVSEFEQAVFQLEKVVIRIRLPKETELPPYTFARPANGDFQIGDWMKSRIMPSLPDGTQVSVIGRDYQEANPSKMLAWIRIGFCEYNPRSATRHSALKEGAVLGRTSSTKDFGG